MLTPQQQAALVKIADASVAAERMTGLPAEVSAAQCIFESGWLARAPGNNAFGIKDTDRFPGSQYVLTTEFKDGQWYHPTLTFEVYPTLESCFVDHAKLITGALPYVWPGIDRRQQLRIYVYTPAWNQYRKDHDMDRFIKTIGPIYATDPGYAAKILQEAHSQSVAMAVQKARASAAEAL